MTEKEYEFREKFCTRCGSVRCPSDEEVIKKCSYNKLTKSLPKVTCNESRTEDFSFISGNMKQINLPIPLGASFYKYILACNNMCYITDNSQIGQIKDRIECNHNAICHTRLHSVKKEVLTLDNLAYFIREYGKTCFATEYEATTKAKRVIKENIDTLRSFGIEIDENGKVISNKK